MANIYYEPEAFGLQLFAEVDDADANYSFSKVVVWQDPFTFDYFWAHDSGCSCPSPFEDVHGREDLTRFDDWGGHCLKDVLSAAVQCGASLDARISFERRLEGRPLG